MPRSPPLSFAPALRPPVPGCQSGVAAPRRERSRPRAPRPLGERSARGTTAGARGVGEGNGAAPPAGASCYAVVNEWGLRACAVPAGSL